VYAWPKAPESASGDFTLRLQYRPKQGTKAVLDTPIRVHKRGETPLHYTPADAPGGPYHLGISTPASGATFLPGETFVLAVQSAIDSKLAYFYTILYSQDQRDLVLSQYGKPGYRMVPNPKAPSKSVYQYEMSLVAPFEKSPSVQRFLVCSYLVSMKGD